MSHICNSAGPIPAWRIDKSGGGPKRVWALHYCGFRWPRSQGGKPEEVQGQLHHQLPRQELCGPADLHVANVLKPDWEFQKRICEVHRKYLCYAGPGRISGEAERMRGYIPQWPFKDEDKDEAHDRCLWQICCHRNLWHNQHFEQSFSWDWLRESNRHQHAQFCVPWQHHSRKSTSAAWFANKEKFWVIRCLLHLLWIHLRGAASDKRQNLEIVVGPCLRP